MRDRYLAVVAVLAFVVGLLIGVIAGDTGCLDSGPAQVVEVGV